MRIKRGVAAHKRHKKILKATKGYRGLPSRTFKMARQAFFKAGEHSLMDRRKRRRTFRSLWIQRINAGVRPHGMTYSQFQHGLKLAGISLDRKILSDLATREPESFKTIVEQVKAAIPAKAAV